MRQNLKEAEGKVPARRTGTAYKAVISGRGGQYLQSPIVTQKGMEVDAAGIWNEGRASYPGRSVTLLCATDIARCRDGVAEVSRGHTSRFYHPTKGRTCHVKQSRNSGYSEQMPRKRTLKMVRPDGIRWI